MDVRPHFQTKKTNYCSLTSFLFDFFYLLDHFLQPKDKNTQHKLKISHLIVYNFSYLIISYFQSDIHTHLEAMELGFSSTCQCWLEKVNLMPTPKTQQISYHIVLQSGQVGGGGGGGGRLQTLFKIRWMSCLDLTGSVNMVTILKFFSKPFSHWIRPT